jgi:hypothetical protein
MEEMKPYEENSQSTVDPETRYYIFQRELFRVRPGDAMPDAWDKGSWVKRPFAFEVESRGRFISEAEAEEWIQYHIRSSRMKSGRQKRES